MEEFLLMETGLEDFFEIANCGPSATFRYKDKNGELKTLIMRQVFSFFYEGINTDSISGVWIVDHHLDPLEKEESVETYKPGKHVKTINLVMGDSEVTLVEYSDRLQLAIKQQGMILSSEYYQKVHWGTIKHLMDTATTENALLGIKDRLKELKNV